MPTDPAFWTRPEDEVVADLEAGLANFRKQVQLTAEEIAVVAGTVADAEPGALAAALAEKIAGRQKVDPYQLRQGARALRAALGLAPDAAADPGDERFNNEDGFALAIGPGALPEGLEARVAQLREIKSQQLAAEAAAQGAPNA